MLLPGKLRTRCKHEAQKLIDFGFLVNLQVLPEETVHQSVFWKQYKLVVHLTDVSDKSQPFFSKRDKDIKDVTLKLRSGQGICGLLPLE